MRSLRRFPRRLGTRAVMTGNDADDDMFPTLARRRPLRQPSDTLRVTSISCISLMAFLMHATGLDSPEGITVPWERWVECCGQDFGDQHAPSLVLCHDRRQSRMRFILGLPLPITRTATGLYVTDYTRTARRKGAMHRNDAEFVRTDAWALRTTALLPPLLQRSDESEALQIC